jgi:hypothetical protein
MSNTDKETKKKKKSYSGLYFLAALIVATTVLVMNIKENKRAKQENELLAYEVW